MKDSFFKKIINVITKKYRIIILILTAFLMIAFFMVYSEKSFDWESERKDSNEIIVLDDSTPISFDVKGENNNKMTGFSLKFATFARNNDGQLYIRVKEDENTIYEDLISTSLLSDNEYYKFDLDRSIIIDENKSYSIEIMEKYDGDNYVALYKDSESDSPSYTITYRNNKKRFIIISLCVIMLIIVLGLIVRDAKDTTIMILILGFLLSLFLLVIPLGRVPDEGNHFFRAYEIANVSLISEHVGDNGEGGNYLPTNIHNYMNKDEELDVEHTRPVTFGTMSLYAPVSYLPQSIGIKIAGLFTNNISNLYFWGRFGNALCSFILCALALIILPFGKRALFVILTFPMTLQEMISLSPDGFTISLSIFFLACILKCANSNETICKKYIMMIVISGLVLSLCKIVYVIILPAVFLIPLKLYENKKIGRIVRGVLLGGGLALNLIWLKISSGFLIEFQPGVNSGEQVKFILLNPLHYCKIILNTLKQLPNWIKEMIGENLGIYEAPVTAIVWIGFLLILVYELENDNIKGVNIIKSRFILFAVQFICGVVLIFTSLYVQWTAYKNGTINGIQGRYFTPLMGLLIVSILVLKNKEKRNGWYYSALVILFLDSIAIIDVSNRFIGTY